jgi:hypothetical protein
MNFDKLRDNEHGFLPFMKFNRHVSDLHWYNGGTAHYKNDIIHESSFSMQNLQSISGNADGIRWGLVASAKLRKRLLAS